MIIKGIQKTTLIDYPGEVATTLFTPKCNFKCHFCYNKNLVLDQDLEEISEEKVIGFLKKRKKLVNSVCITGGEPTLQKDLVDFIRKIKKLGFKVKLDTNGSDPAVVRRLLDENLLDYIAMDIKGPLKEYKVIVNEEIDAQKIRESIGLILNSKIGYEFRTTVLPRLHSKKGITGIAMSVKGAKKYVLQQFVKKADMLDPGYKDADSFKEKELEEIRKECNKYVSTELRI